MRGDDHHLSHVVRVCVVCGPLFFSAGPHFWRTSGVDVGVDVGVSSHAPSRSRVARESLQCTVPLSALGRCCGVVVGCDEAVAYNAIDCMSPSAPPPRRAWHSISATAARLCTRLRASWRLAAAAREGLHGRMHGRKQPMTPRPRHRRCRPTGSCVVRMCHASPRRRAEGAARC